MILFIINIQRLTHIIREYVYQTVMVVGRVWYLVHRTLTLFILFY